MRRTAILLSLAGYILVTILPVATLLVSPGSEAGTTWPSAARLLPLLARSLALSLPVSAAALLFSLCLATFAGGATGRFVLIASCATLLVPPHINLVAWARPLDAVEQLLSPAWGMSPLGGWGASAWIEFVSFAPFAVAATLLGTRIMDGEKLDAARLLDDDGRAFRSVAVPLMMPFASAGAVLCFLMSILDFSVPSHFQWNVLALEIFSDFSATGNAHRTAALALPLVTVAALFATLALIPGGRALRAAVPSRPAVPDDLAFPTGMRVARSAALLVFAIIIVTPLASLIAEAVTEGGAVASVIAAQQEIFNSVQTAAAASLLAILVAVGPAVLLRSTRRGRGIAWALVLPPLVAPAPLIGVALIAATQRGPASMLYGTAALPILAATARFAPWAVLLLAAQFSRAGGASVDASRISPAPRARVFLRILLPLAAPGIAAALFLVFGLAMGELGATILVAPPGGATLTLRLFNYLHYGASGSVAGLALAAVALAFIPGAAAVALLPRRSA